jgi:hypothetical protein
MYPDQDPTEFLYHALTLAMWFLTLAIGVFVALHWRLEYFRDKYETISRLSTITTQEWLEGMTDEQLSEIVRDLEVLEPLARTLALEEARKRGVW